MPERPLRVSVVQDFSPGTLHHAAFDAHMLGIRPDYVIEIREDVLDEKDGPTLKSVEAETGVLGGRATPWQV